MQIRKATDKDIKDVCIMYSFTHTAEECGLINTGWKRDVYPTQKTAKEALKRGDLFVGEKDGRVVASAIINQIQVDVYDGAPWKYKATNDEVMVLHTLVVSPDLRGNGFGKSFVKYYEEYAKENGAKYLRMDTNEKNKRAREFYKTLGYEEIGVVPCEFNGIKDVNLVLIEKKLR